MKYVDPIELYLFQLLVTWLKEQKDKELRLARPAGGRPLEVTVGKVAKPVTLEAANIRELEDMLGLSINQREKLAAYLRSAKVPMEPRVREKLMAMDRWLDDWYETAELEIEERREVKKEEDTGEKGVPDPEPEPEPASLDGDGGGEGGSGVGKGGGRGRGRGRGRGTVRGRGGAAQGQTVDLLPPPEVRRRPRREAAALADISLEQSVDKGEMLEKDCEAREINGPKKKKVKKTAKPDPKIRTKKSKKKKKVYETIKVRKPLVYVTNVAAFLEMIREERGIPAEECMVRLAIDAGQGSLKVVANLFNRY